jgi:hypothetical protein
MKKLIVASAFAALVGFGMSTAAEAKTNFQLYLGYPHYDYRPGDDYRYRDGYGWYNPGYRVRPQYNVRLSCNEARREVRRKGFRNVSAIECNGRTYTFRAVRNGNRMIVYVNSRSGAVWRG